MATPIGHGLMGVATALLVAKNKDVPRLYPLALGTMLAIAPDLDFLPGIFLGKPAILHQGISHSLGVALAVGLLGALLIQIHGWSRRSVFMLVFLAYTSHLFLDLFGADERLPYGIPIFWPLSSDHFQSPAQILPGVHHSRTTSTPTAQWFEEILQWYNLYAVFIEMFLVAPFLLLAIWVDKRRNKANHGR